MGERTGPQAYDILVYSSKYHKLGCHKLYPSPMEEMDLDPNENGFDKSCINVVGTEHFWRKC